MNTRNYYYRNIVKNLTGDESSKPKSDNYYLKQIYLHFGGDDVNKKKSDNYYLREIIELITNELITEKKPNNYYLKELYNYFGGTATNKRMSDFYYLKQIMILSEDQPLEASLTISVDKNIVAENMVDKNVVATAILLDGDEEPIANEVVTFVVEYGTAKDTSTAQTDSNGEASFTYTSNGNGDVKISAGYHNISDSVTFEDYMYYNTNEMFQTLRNHSTIYDNNLSLALPSKCEISFDFHSNVSGNYDHRFFLLPKSQFSTSTTQPQYALYVEQNNSSQGSIGKRENNNSILILSKFNCQGSTYHTIKWVRDGTSIDIYVDDELKTTQTIEWIDNYDDYCFCMMIWSSTYTSKMKNAKIKALY